jgi:endonuclease/exonuclease/phosphatase family metal-dependent hydrolase
MMKRILAFALILALLLTMPFLYACDDTTDDQPGEDETQDPAGDNDQPGENEDPDENEEPEGPKTVTLRIGSFNIKNGTDVQHNMKKLADEIVALDLDIVGLQEVDRFAKRSQYLDTMERLSELTGYEYYYYSKAINITGDPAAYGQEGEYGTGILSKYPIVFEETTEISSANYEQRVLGSAVIEIDEGIHINFFNTHLTYDTLEIREQQMQEINAIMGNSTYCILTGDFNVESIEEFEKFNNLTGASNKENPLESYWYWKQDPWPTGCIDNVLYSKEFTLKDCGVSKKKLSDHYLLWAELEITLDEVEE